MIQTYEEIENNIKENNENTTNISKELSSKTIKITQDNIQNQENIILMSSKNNINTKANTSSSSMIKELSTSSELLALSLSGSKSSIISNVKNDNIIKENLLFETGIYHEKLNNDDSKDNKYKNENTLSTSIIKKTKIVEIQKERINNNKEIENKNGDNNNDRGDSNENEGDNNGNCCSIGDKCNSINNSSRSSNCSDNNENGKCTEISIHKPIKTQLEKDFCVPYNIINNYFSVGVVSFKNFLNFI